MSGGETQVLTLKFFGVRSFGTSAFGRSEPALRCEAHDR